MKKIHLALLYLALIAFISLFTFCNDSGPGDGLQRKGTDGRLMIGDSARTHLGNIFYYDSKGNKYIISRDTCYMYEAAKK